ncbi:MAG: hypothetical protein WAN35_05560 [Terracidiphilus sp.]
MLTIFLSIFPGLEQLDKKIIAQQTMKAKDCFERTIVFPILAIGIIHSDGRAKPRLLALDTMNFLRAKSECLAPPQVVTRRSAAG